MEDELQEPRPPRKSRERLSQSTHAASFPFYFRDWLASPEVRALSREERGAYIDVLASTWQTRTVGVMTEEQVRAWAGYSPAEWKAHREALKACFRVRSDGLWVQKRAKREREAQKRRFKSASEAGKKSAAKRKGGNEVTKVVADSVGEGVRTESEPCPRSLVLGPSERQVVPSTDGSRAHSPNGHGTAGLKAVGEILNTLPAVAAARRASP